MFNCFKIAFNFQQHDDNIKWMDSLLWLILIQRIIGWDHVYDDTKTVATGDFLYEQKKVLKKSSTINLYIFFNCDS